MGTLSEFNYDRWLRKSIYQLLQFVQTNSGFSRGKIRRINYINYFQLHTGYPNIWALEGPISRIYNRNF